MYSYSVRSASLLRGRGAEVKEGEKKMGGKEEEIAVLGTPYATVTSLAIKIRCDARRQRPAQYWTCPPVPFI